MFIKISSVSEVIPLGARYLSSLTSSLSTYGAHGNKLAVIECLDYGEENIQNSSSQLTLMTVWWPERPPRAGFFTGGWT